LAARQAYPELFEQGDYQPLFARGNAEDSVVAFARQRGNQWMVAIAPRFLTQLTAPGDYPIDKVWADTTLTLPGHVQNWQNWITGETVTSAEDTPLSTLLATFPVAILIGEAAD
jgi:(1->4)-alpha-D-glucan 1-alpha-D-glucosylmutase